MKSILPQWEKEGFDGVTEQFVSKGIECILRAYSSGVPDLQGAHGTSNKIGNCFFVPGIGRFNGEILGFNVNKRLWTGPFLEERLNAFVWGNTFDRLTVWRLIPGVKYEIGSIGQNTRFDPGDGSGVQRYLDWPGGDRTYFRQVKIVSWGANVPINRANITACIQEIDDFATIKPITHRVGNT